MDEMSYQLLGHIRHLNDPEMGTARCHDPHHKRDGTVNSYTLSE